MHSILDQVLLRKNRQSHYTLTRFIRENHKTILIRKISKLVKNSDNVISGKHYIRIVSSTKTEEIQHLIKELSALGLYNADNRFTNQFESNHGYRNNTD